MDPTDTPSAPSPDGLGLNLAALGRRLLRLDLVGKVDLSGVVQQTLLDAHTAGQTFPAADPAQRETWLRRVFRRNLTDSVRRATARRRDVTREVTLDDPAGRLVSDGSSPSAPARRAEEAARLKQALAALPADQARAVELRHLHGRSVEGIAAEFGRSKVAVAGLIKRGLRALRERMPDPDGSGT
jgi:RNA polymerase sigma-70 factor (ECF subfamily)